MTETPADDTTGGDGFPTRSADSQRDASSTGPPAADIERRRGELRWRVTLDAVRDAILVLDAQLRVIRLNAAAANVYRIAGGERLDPQCYVFTHGAISQSEELPIVRARLQKQRAEGEFYELARDRWVLVLVDPVVEDDQVTGFVYTVRDITARKRSQLALQQAYQQIETLKKRLERENTYLREQVQPVNVSEAILGNSPSLRKVLELAERVADSKTTVLITGETGTGKELIAGAIHAMSRRCDRVMVRVNCAALPPSLIESELFGREKGAYTGAETRQIGRFELADGATLLLDEVGELSLELQAKLLHVLQSGCFERLGSTDTLRADVRIIAATNRDMAQAVRLGKFREDLFYRLNVFPIHVPPLRERTEDIPLLLQAFVQEFGQAMVRVFEPVPQATLQALQRYPWPGNIRELRNVVERAVIMSRDTTLRIEIPVVGSDSPVPQRTLEEMERSYVREVLDRTGWRIRGSDGAAAVLGLKPTTLEFKMKKLGIQRRGDSREA